MIKKIYNRLKELERIVLYERNYDANELIRIDLDYSDNSIFLSTDWDAPDGKEFERGTWIWLDRPFAIEIDDLIKALKKARKALRKNI